MSLAKKIYTLFLLLPLAGCFSADREDSAGGDSIGYFRFVEWAKLDECKPSYCKDPKHKNCGHSFNLGKLKKKCDSEIKSCIQKRMAEQAPCSKIMGRRQCKIQCKKDAAPSCQEYDKARLEEQKKCASSETQCRKRLEKKCEEHRNCLSKYFYRRSKSSTGISGSLDSLSFVKTSSIDSGYIPQAKKECSK